MAQPLWDTQDGQKWLAKAIDPAGNNVDIRGLPDQESHNVVVLNYQSQYVVEPPTLYNQESNDGATYETEMYLFQHPYLFGVSATFPTGTDDILSHTTGAKICFGQTPAAAHDQVPAIVGTSPSISFTGITGKLFPRTCKIFKNTQVAGEGSIKEIYEAFSKMSQQHRIIYGAAQLIPTCSAQDNSGSISVSQQPFVADGGNNSTVRCFNGVTPDTPVTVGEGGATAFTFGEGGGLAETFAVNIYRENDFPKSEDNIRNPASLLTRFYEGAYIPYKLKNPFHESFISSYTGVAQISPAWVIGAAYIPVGQTQWSAMTWDVLSSSFVPFYQPGSTTERVVTRAKRIRITFVTKTGQVMHIIFGNDTNTNVIRNLNLTWAQEEVLNGITGGGKFISTSGPSACFSKTPTGADDQPINNDWVYYYRSTESGHPVVPFPNDNIIAVVCKAMNMKGNIQLLIRMGVEMIVTGESTYSPFNHKSPEYDESAIKSYLRVCHRMSDGFYGNAATEALASTYYNWYMQQLYDPPQGVDFANRGSYWRGLVSVK